MENKFTDDHINDFFTKFKKLPELLEIEQVERIVENYSYEKPKTRRNKIFTPKTLIMISLSSIGFIYLIFSFFILKTTQSSIEINPNQKTSDTEVKIETFDIPVEFESLDIKIGPEDKNPNLETVLPSKKENLQSLGPEFTDTIDGKMFLVKLSDQELQKLGFLVDETGLFYHNVHRDTKVLFHGRHEKGAHGWSGGELSRLAGIRDPNNKKEVPSTFDFYPVAISNTVFSPSSLLIGDYTEFSSINDTLVPIYIPAKQLRYGYNDVILWFLPTQKFFASLPNRFNHLKAAYEGVLERKRNLGQSDIVKYEPHRLVTKAPFIELDQPGLEKMGFRFLDKSLEFSTVQCDDYVTLSFFSSGRQSMTVYDSIPPHITTAKLGFVSDEYGIQNVKWKCKGDAENKLSSTYFLNKIAFLVPIVVRKDLFPNILVKNQIFWFEPSDELFVLLPPQLGGELKAEFEFISDTSAVKGKLSANCNYFEVCRSTLKLDKFKVYPNPATRGTNIQFNMDRELSGTISLANINGKEVKLLRSHAKFVKGMNNYYLDLTGVRPGIFLIVLRTEAGFKTHRIIILQ